MEYVATARIENKPYSEQRFDVTRTHVHTGMHTLARIRKDTHTHVHTHARMYTHTHAERACSRAFTILTEGGTWESVHYS